MKHRQIKQLICIFLLSFSVPAISFCQNQRPDAVPGDSLALDRIIQEVVQNHPMVKSANEAINAADAQIGLARSGYYPNIGITAGYSNVGPVPTLQIPDIGTFSLFPKNNFTGQLNVLQSVYDFGKTNRNVAFASEGKSITEQSLEMTKQNLALKAIQIYYSLNYLQEAIKIKIEQLETLNDNLDFIQRKKDTGSAISYEVLSTKVRISGTQSQKLDLEAARDVQLAELNLLLGLPAKTFHNVKSELTAEKPAAKGDSLLTYAYENRNEMQIAKVKEHLASMRYDVVRLQNTPSLNFVANGGMKNGYIPEINKIKPNYVVGLGLTIPLFDATREKYNLLQAKSAVDNSSYETEITRRKISGEVVESETYIQTASEKVTQAKLQLEQAQEALALAEVSYKSGVITNLDLLYATTAVSESRLMLLKSQIDYMVNIYRLDA